MANQYSADVPKGFNVPKQVRLDSITAIQNELALKNLGAGNNLAFKYYEGLKVYCKDEKTEYVWRQIIGVETGLLTTHFIYPTYTAVDGIDYSGKSFNFFLLSNSGTPANGSETKINSGTNTTVTGLGTTASPYVINSTDTIANGSETKLSEGTNVNITGIGTILDPYIINTDLGDFGIVKTIDNEVITPGQTLSIINNETTGKVLVTKEYVQSVIPATPNGSETKINPGDNVTITGNGTVATPYIINSINEDTTIYINSGTYIEVIGNGTIDNPYIINSTNDQFDNLSTVAITGNYSDLLNFPQTKNDFNNELTNGDFLFVGDVVQYTNEMSQDAVGNILTDTSTINFTYNDVSNIITADLTDNINVSKFINDSNYSAKAYTTQTNLTPGDLAGVISATNSVTSTNTIIGKISSNGVFMFNSIQEFFVNYFSGSTLPNIIKSEVFLKINNGLFCTDASGTGPITEIKLFGYAGDTYVFNDYSGLIVSQIQDPNPLIASYSYLQFLETTITSNVKVEIPKVFFLRNTGNTRSFGAAEAEFCFIVRNTVGYIDATNTIGNNRQSSIRTTNFAIFLETIR